MEEGLVDVVVWQSMASSEAILLDASKAGGANLFLLFSRFVE